MFRRICERCAELVVCARDESDELTCVKCGGMLLGPVALPTPTTYRERCEILGSAHYMGAVARRRRR